MFHNPLSLAPRLDEEAGKKEEVSPSHLLLCPLRLSRETGGERGRQRVEVGGHALEQRGAAES